MSLFSRVVMDFPGWRRSAVDGLAWCSVKMLRAQKVLFGSLFD